MGDETLGQRIRRARLERGLTLAQVAGEDFSRAFLNQVEMGRSQPSTRVLRVIATRLGEPLDYLVEGSLIERELVVERARLALDRGRHQAALELVEDEERLLRARGDAYRLRRLEALFSGRRPTLDAAGHERLAELALRQDRRELALEHFRAARILREAAQPPAVVG